MHTFSLIVQLTLLEIDIVYKQDAGGKGHALIRALFSCSQTQPFPWNHVQSSSSWRRKVSAHNKCTYREIQVRILCQQLHDQKN